MNPWTAEASAAGARWQAPPSALTLAGDEVHVWRASLECPPARLAELADLVSEDEQIRANRFRFERDRNRFIAGRGTLRVLLGRYLGIDPGALQFRYSAAGKPALAWELDLAFNVTHSNALALYAVSRSEVGVDVEQVREINDAEEIANRFFTSGERAELDAVPRARRMEGFLRAWTRKEACLKACGLGIAAAMNRCEVPPHDEAASLKGGAGNVLESCEWWLHDLTPAPGYLAAVASRGATRKLSCFDPERRRQSE